MRRSPRHALLFGEALLWISAASRCDPAHKADEGREPETMAGCRGTRPDGALCLISVAGRVVDETNQPVPDLPVTVCGATCFRETTDDVGYFAIEIKHFAVVSDYSVQAHGSPHASTFYHRLPQGRAGRIDVGTLRVLELPSDDSTFATKLDLSGSTAPEQLVTSGPVSIEIGAGTVVRLSIGDALKGEEGARFRARELTEGEIEDFAPELKDARVFALGPFEADFLSEDEREPNVAVRVDNSQSWPSGSEVEVLALGTYLDAAWLAPAEFQFIGTAVVSSDGATIELAAGADGPGLLHLTWIAFRP